jgi:ribonuclease P protein component
MESPKRHIIRKHEILRSDKEIQEVFRKGKKIHGKYLTLYYLIKKKSDNNKIKVFFHIRKKDVRKASERNRIKRLMREVHRLNKHVWSEKLTDEQCLYLALSFKNLLLPNFEEVKTDYIFFLNTFKSPTD